MTLLDRYIGRQMVATVIKTIVSLVAFVVVIDLLTHRREDISKYDVPWSIVAQYYLLYIPRILVEFQIAGVSVLIAGLLVLGRAAQNNELVAALAGGISLRRIALTPIIVALTLAVMLFLFGETVAPDANKEARRIEERYFSKNPDNERAGVSWAHLAGDWSCHILKFNRQAMTGEHIMLDKLSGEPVEHIEANRIYWDEQRGAWLMEDGVWSAYYVQEDMAAHHQRFSQREAPINESPEILFALDESFDTKSAAQLAQELRYAESRGSRVAHLWVDYHTKFSKPALCFIMILLAIPFAVRLRRGGLLVGFGASIAIALTYLLLFEISRGLGQLIWLPPFLSAWLANMVFFTIGVTLFFKTPT